jgi:tetratricopeptide (TPR) repeat protein
VKGVVRRCIGIGAACLALAGQVCAAPYIPARDDEVLATLPAGARHADPAIRAGARARIDVALPLAQFYIREARATGDLRFLGYADAVLAPWVSGAAPNAAALVLQATLQQSRHEFARSLGTLDRALALAPDDPQAWLTRATVLRVLGRYGEADAACTQFARRTDERLALICHQGVAALTGHLATAYAEMTAVNTGGMTDAERAWREAELGDMAVRLGRNAEAGQWYRSALLHDPADLYVRAALADLLLAGHRDAEVLALLSGRDSIEPLLLRIAIAQKALHDPRFDHSRELLRAAFAAEAARGEPVHQREQARFLVEVEGDPRAGLQAALSDWAVQREPADVLVLVEAATAAGSAAAAQPALAFVTRNGLQDVRVTPAGWVGS